MARQLNLASLDIAQYEGEQMEFRHMVRTVSIIGREDVAANLFSARTVEKELSELAREGWKLMGQPTVLGPEGYADVQVAGYRIMYFLTRGG